MAKDLYVVQAVRSPCGLLRCNGRAFCEKVVASFRHSPRSHGRIIK